MENIENMLLWISIYDFTLSEEKLKIILHNEYSEIMSIYINAQILRGK